MARAVRTLAAGLVLGLALTAQVSAQNTNPQRLMVLVDDHAGVPADILQGALDVTGKIFRQIDVDIVWLGHDDARLADAAVLTSVVVVRILTREMTDRLGTPSGILGRAASGTRFATVFYNRIEDLSPTHNGNETACTLGYVIAHELGHLLLPPKAHTAAGIMRGDVDGVSAGQGLWFGAGQARLIKANLSAKLAAARAN